MLNVIRYDIYLFLYKQLIPSLAVTCKLFSHNSKPTHALLASKRYYWCPIKLFLRSYLFNSE